jgi:glucosyl-3-phosphoglycerate synthase
MIDRAPSPELLAVVVVPARDEEERIGRCLRALGSQDGLRHDQYEVILVLDDCRDGTARMAARHVGSLTVHAVEGPALGVGAARALGMELAGSRLLSVRRPAGLIASTDADSWVAGDWLRRQLDAVADGAQAIGGQVILDPEEAGLLDPGTIFGREERLRSRLAALVASAGAAPREHPHFAGASIGITAAAYARTGGFEALDALEDEALARRLHEVSIDIHRLDSVRVHTSARINGRTPLGLARDLARSESDANP